MSGTDNQNRDLDAVKRNMDRLRMERASGCARFDAAQPSALAEWTFVDDVLCLRVAGRDYVAVPSTGRRNAALFDVIQLSSRRYVCQLRRAEALRWLMVNGRD